jgi:hypothetical protein
LVLRLKLRSKRWKRQIPQYSAVNFTLINLIFDRLPTTVMQLGTRILNCDMLIVRHLFIV